MSTHRFTTHGLVATTARLKLRLRRPSVRAAVAWRDEPGQRARTPTSANGRMYSLLLRSAERPDRHRRF